MVVHSLCKNAASAILVLASLGSVSALQFQSNSDVDVEQRPGCNQIPAHFSPYKDPLWSPGQLKLGFAPLRHMGARHLLQSKLLAAKAGVPTNILVLGGSMTYGAESTCKWSTLLQSMMSMFYRNVTVSNYAKRGSTSASILMHMDEILEIRPDVILVDYAVNDGYALKADGTRGRDIETNITERLVKGLLSLPSKPAVVYVETFSGFHTAPVGFSCSHSLDEFPHWPALTSLDVPVVSYYDASCSEKTTAAFATHWRADSAHPPCSVHTQLADLIGRFLIVNTVEACRRGPSPRDHPPKALQVSPEQQCLMHPASKLYSTLLSEDNQMNSYSTLKISRRFPATVIDKDVWHFFPDVIGKFGWIANPGIAGDIEFQVKTSGRQGSFVFVEYLITYENIGNALCWFVDDPGQKYRLDGHSRAKVSISEMLAISTAHLPAGMNRLRCHSDGAKFKISKLDSC